MNDGFSLEFKDPDHPIGCLVKDCVWHRDNDLCHWRWANLNANGSCIMMQNEEEWNEFCKNIREEIMNGTKEHNSKM